MPKTQITLNFASKPVLVFWETTRACALSCVHCRASAITEPLPGELDNEQGRRLIDQVAKFGSPYPTLIFTGGDPLKRSGIFELLHYSADRGISFALSPAMTDAVTPEVLAAIKDLGASSISISLDGACAEVHDSIRGVPGIFEKSITVMKQAATIGLTVQVNTAVMERNFLELPRIFHLIKGLGVRTWELFFLVKVGRGNSIEDLSPEENESVCNFLYDASRRGVVLRCVEAPFIRRVLKQRTEMGDYWGDNEIYRRLRDELVALEGEIGESARSTLRPVGTLDGDGIIFVAYDGSVHPGGFVPVNIGNTRFQELSEIYRNSELLQNIRERRFSGKCGKCSFKGICGGSRARAYAYYGDPLASDPACIYAR